MLPLEAYPAWAFDPSPVGVLWTELHQIPWSLGLPGRLSAIGFGVGKARVGLPFSVGQEVVRCPNIMLLF